ncbi:hypothetical protein TNCV_424021 [Trichonephila clavipes]|nr:hypothetical protein TNCV_424021 [Trichonephila clavipes]
MPRVRDVGSWRPNNQMNQAPSVPNEKILSDDVRRIVPSARSFFGTSTPDTNELHLPAEDYAASPDQAILTFKELNISKVEVMGVMHTKEKPHVDKSSSFEAADERDADQPNPTCAQ